MTIDCRDSVGGLREVLFIEFDNVTSVDEVSGVVTGIVVASGKQFRRYVLQKETSSFTETPNANPQNGTIFYQQVLTIVINKMQTNTRNELGILGMARLLAIALDQNDRYWLLGKQNALDLTGGEGGTGTASGDRNGYTREFTGSERNMAPEVSSSIISALLQPAA